MAVSYTRINVVGNSGSGKTPLSKEIASILDVPRIEMDALFWQPNWTQTPREEFFKSLQQAISGERWVLDGNYNKTLNIKWARAQMVVWLDLPFLTILGRVFRRSVRLSISKEELWAGNTESFRNAFFSRNSIILWSIGQFRRNRARYSSAISNPANAHIKFVRLRSPQQVNEFLQELREQTDRP